MTLQEALNKTWARLRHARIPEPRLDAEYLVAEAAGISRLRLPLQAGSPLSPAAELRLAQWTRERLERRPLAYVLGEQPFFHLTMRVTPSVLVPRPETEMLVEEATRFLDTCTSAVVIDVGTGSGNIALSLASHPRVAEIHAIDISSDALAIAQENALRNRTPRPVQWHLGNLLSPIKDKQVTADLIVANLPYVCTDEMPELSPEVRWEPALALDGGRDGLAYILQVIEQAHQILRPGGVLMLEIGATQGDAVQNRLAVGTGWINVRLQHDLAGLPRIIKAQKGGLVGSFNN